MSLPNASNPAGILIVALPLLRAVEFVEKPPVPVRITEPVGVRLSLPALTATVTVNPCIVVMLVEEGVTVTVGVVVGSWYSQRSFSSPYPPPESKPPPPKSQRLPVRSVQSMEEYRPPGAFPAAATPSEP